MPFQKKQIIPIDYTNRDFQSIKKGLVEHAKRYYPKTYKDFSDSGFGSLMLDSVSYIGDMLSFYLDYHANESYLSTALEYSNVMKLAHQMGYNPRTTASSTGNIAFYITVPAVTGGRGPNTQYIPLLKKGSKFASTTGATFSLIEDVNFAAPGNEIITVASSAGVATKFAIKAYGRVVSGDIITETLKVGNYKKFLRLRMNGRNITEIIDVIDGNGSRYYEVDHLAQNIVHTAIGNQASDKNTAPFILKPILVPRRFTVEQEREVTYLQFGFGSETNLTTEKVVDPTKVVLDMHGKDYVTEKSFDPSLLMETDKLGVVPSNTSLIVACRVNTADNVNAGVGQVSEVVTPMFSFTDPTNLISSLVGGVRNSLELENELPILGDVFAPNSEEIKYRAYGAYYSQNRAVTREDYKSLIYRMPGKFGSVMRCSVIKDTNSFKRNLNVYVISEDESGLLTATTPSIKQNIKTWLNNYKMLNDTIDILDVKIVNFGIEFDLVSDIESDKYEVLTRATEAIRTRLFRIAFDIGESFQITSIYKVLRNVTGVLDVTSVRLVSKVGGSYSSAFYDLDKNITPDGRILLVPENVILEVKYPKADLRGTVR